MALGISIIGVDVATDNIVAFALSGAWRALIFGGLDGVFVLANCSHVLCASGRCCDIELTSHSAVQLVDVEPAGGLLRGFIAITRGIVLRELSLGHHAAQESAKKDD